MKERGISQEQLKIIACVSMLLDHIGAVIVLECFENATGANRYTLLHLYESLRMIGRLAFPIYCFLLSEGSWHTRDPKRYGQRLLLAALVSEIPYDLAFDGRINWGNQNVMITLFLGFLMLQAMKKCKALGFKLLVIAPFAMAAQLLHSDYGADGIFVIALFALTRDNPWREILQFLGLWCIFSPNHLMALNWVTGGFALTVQELATLAVVPIALYKGRKSTSHKVVQWAFYCFYPVHLLVLFLIGRL